MRRMMIVVLAVLVLAAPLALAQKRGGRGNGPDARVQQRVEMLWIWRLTEELQLDEETAAKLFPLIRERNQAIRELEKEKREIGRTLQQAEQNGKTLSKPEVLAVVDKFTAKDVEIHRARAAMLKDVSGVLTDEQFQKFVLVHSRLQGEIRGMIRDAVRGQRGQGRGGPRGGGGFQDEEPPPPPDMGDPFAE